MKKLNVGDKVECRLYNTPDKHFYGSVFIATIVVIGIQNNPNMPWYIEPETIYTVQRIDTSKIKLRRKEIIRRTK